MLHGPLSTYDLERLSKALTTLAIPFKVEENQDELREQEAVWKANPLSSRSGASYAPQFLYLELDDADAERFRPDLEKLGITALTEAPDFDAVDYVCPNCRHFEAEPGTCPTHGLRLLEWNEYITLRNQRDQASRNWIWRVLIVVVLAAAAYFTRQALF